MSLPRPVLLACALAAALSWRSRPLAAGAAEPAPAREAAYRENNLGVALLEQFRFGEAAEAFRQALAKDPQLLMARFNLAIALLYVPDLPGAKREAEAALAVAGDAPQPNYVLGLVARTEGRAEEAVPYLQKVLAADPKDVGANLTLGQVYLQERRFEEAIAAFQTALDAEPYNVSAAYNVGVALTRAGHAEEGRVALQRFQKLRDSGYKSSFGTTYLDQGKYAEAVSSTGAEADSVDPKTPAVAFVERDEATAGGPVTSSPGPLLGRSVTAAEAAKALPRAALVLADLDGDGALDVVEAGLPALRVLRSEEGQLRDVTEKAGLSGIPAIAAVAGDYDNDGRPDLLVLRPGGLSLFHNEGGFRFKDVTVAAQLPAWPYLSATAAFVDYDHDGDLDILVAGLADLASTPAGKALSFPGDFASAPALLLQNNGNGTFTDATASAKVGAAGHALVIIPTDFDNRRDVDLFVLRHEGPALFKNMRDGSFRDMAAELGLLASGPFLSAAAADVNKDGFTDFFLGGEGRSFLALSDGRGAFHTVAAPEGSAGAQAAQFVDYDNDGLLDLFLLTAKGPRLFRNLGTSWSDVSSSAFGGSLRATALEGAALALADLDADGDEDAVVATPSRLRILSNEGGNHGHSFAVRLEGRVSNKGGVGAKVEIRAGSLRQKLETSSAVPMAAPADVIFGLGPRLAPDAVRVIWASGVVQTETAMPAAVAGKQTAALGVTELDRKPSSCPYLYAWNGERFEFVTDFLGAGEMGYWEGPGEWNHPDPVEYVRLAPGQLRARGGRYELRVTNELEEVLYLDEVRLLAIDHPAGVSVYPDEGMTSKAKAFRLFAVRDERTPGVTDASGTDATERARAVDGSFVEGFGLERIRGYAKEHALTLDLSALPARHRVLLLTGWTDYSFSSDNVAARQMGLVTKPPRLEVETSPGRWETAVAEVGVPVGRPQTVVVDLGGVNLGRSARVRVVTNMRVYWDRVAVGEAVKGLDLRPVELGVKEARLRERGFSAERAVRGFEAYGFDYARASWKSPWKTAPGRYTREGDVGELLRSADDLFVVSKPGDEVSLSFEALGEPGAGRARTYLLRGDGFSKEMDIHSASPDVVEPLPYHGMGSYPYAASERPARLRAQAERQAAYDTRVVARPIAPIELAAAGDLRARPAPEGH